MIVRKSVVVEPDDGLPDHLFRWLEAVQRRLTRELQHSAGPDALPLRGRQARLLQLIPARGMRISELADRAATTKQALGQLVDVLERGGWLESRRDPSDARVRLVLRTPRGDALSLRIDALMAEAELVLRDELGADAYDRMKDALRALGADAI